MATQEEIKAIAGLYVAYFDRAPDPEGLQFWIDQLDNGRDFATISQDFATSTEATEIYPFLATPDLVSSSPAAFVTSIFANLFGRAPDQAGLDFWVGVIASGDVAPGDMVEAVLLGAQDTFVFGEQVLDKTTVENKVIAACHFVDSVNTVEGYVFDAAGYTAAQQAIAGVNADPATVAAAELVVTGYVGSLAPTSLFTLQTPTVVVAEATDGEQATQTLLYWGYNPHGHDEDGVDNLDGNNPDGNDNGLTNEGPADGGIPIDEFFGIGGYLQAILGFNLAEIVAVDANNENNTLPAFTNVRDITVTAGDAGTGTLTFIDENGTADDIAISAEYFELLNNILFDEEGNTRFFEVEVAARLPVYVGLDGEPTTVQPTPTTEAIGFVNAFVGATDEMTAIMPIMLTTTANNGSTIFPGFTSDDNDTIVAGRLDMLHQAIIDGGAGINTLEVDAKGHFAQPQQLTNIQQVNITNLPNIYTFENNNGSQYPNVVEGDDSTTSGDPDSILDLSRAIDLEDVTITEGNYRGLDATLGLGDITVVGLRNDATLTLQGNFTQDVYVATGPGNTANGFTVNLQNVTMDGGTLASLFISDNSPVLNLVSNGGGNNIDGISGLFGNTVTDLNVSGSAHLFIENNLNAIFETDTPATIDASANTGGVDLTLSVPESITILGSKGDDRFDLDTTGRSGLGNNGGANDDFDNDQSITITNTGGDNYYVLETYTLDVTSGEGNNNYEIETIDATITAGNGNNHVEGHVVQLDLTAGDGDNRVDIAIFDSPQTTVGGDFDIDDLDTIVNITVGNGANVLRILPEDTTLTADGVSTGFDDGTFIKPAVINITAGDGGNDIIIPVEEFNGLGGSTGAANFDTLNTINITTGAGDDTMVLSGSSITVSSGAGDDDITLVGIDSDYVTEVASIVGNNADGAFNFKGFVASNEGALIDIDTGAGSSIVQLGVMSGSVYDDNGNNGFIVAKEGSSITGADVTLRVNTTADLRAADLSGITAIVMDDDNTAYFGQGFGDGATVTSGAASLTLLDTQLTALGTTIFTTEGETFGAQSILTIVITSDTTLSDLIDFSTWNDSVKLCFVVSDGVELTLTAEELHKYVSPEGIAVDDSNGYNDNQVIITDAGPNFNAYADQNGGTGGGTVAGGLNAQEDVTVLFSPDGYERPEQDPNVALIQWNSDDTPVIDETVYPFATDLVIEGAADLTVTAPIILGPNFTIDFSDFTGDFTMTTDGVETLTVANFQNLTAAAEYADWGQITGNGTDADPVRIDMLLNIEDADAPVMPTVGDTAFGVLNGGLPSTGVQQYVLTGFHDNDASIQSQAGMFTATIVVCDKTEDLQVLGLQNNRNSDVTFEQVNWGTEILFEGDGYANASDQEKNLGNPDLSEVGFITANFFESGANAVVRITNQGTELGLNEDAEDGFDPAGERVLDVAGITLTNADRVLVAVEDGDAVVNALNGNDIERVIVTGPEDVKVFIEGVDGADGTGLNADNLVSIDGTGVTGAFSLCFTDDTMVMGPTLVDLSGVTLTGVDALTLVGDITLTLTADQVVALGGIITSDDSGVTTLNVVEYAGEGIDFSALDVDSIGTITTVDIDGTITVDPAADFGDAASFIILAEDSDTAVQMTVEQFGTITMGDVDMEEGAGTDGTLILTDVPADEELVLTNVTADADGDGIANIELRGSDFVSTEDFMITDGAGGNSATHFITAVLEGGVNDITETPSANLLDLDCLLLEDGATLNITAEQLEILHTFAEEFKIADGANVTVNIVDLSTQELDLDALVEANPGLTIGTITIVDDNSAITINPLTTFGGAAEIITPTADENDPFDGLEDTSVTMTVAQFLSSGGSITGDGMINLTGLANNNDSDADFVLDNALIDTSGITAPTGTISLLEEEIFITDVGETVTLNALTDLSGFEILLTDGQLIRFSTEAQASGAEITDAATVIGNPVGVVWLFDTWSGTEIDTTGYDANIDTLFVDEDLVNGQNEEDIWNTLPGSIVVQKFNDAAPQGLLVTIRQNTFEAFGAAPDGITFDDQNEFQTTGALILKLEGNVTIGDVTIAETLGAGAFDFLEISSTFDAENNPTDYNGNGLVDDGVIIQPNKVGDVFLNAPMQNGLDLVVLLDTSDGQVDVAFANGGTGAGTGADTDDGLALEVGTIFLGIPADGVNFATVDMVGDHDITVEGLDYSNAFLTQVNVETDEFDFTGADLEIGGVNIGDLSEAMGLTGAPDGYLILNNFTADVLTDLDDGFDPASAGDEEIILATDGDVDLTLVGDSDAVFDVDGIHGLSAGTVTLTADQIFAIGTGDADLVPGADAWQLAPGVAPNDITINVYGLSGQVIDLDAVRDAGFNIGTITIVAPGADLDAGTTLGSADQIVIEINEGDGEVTLEMSAEQYNDLADGTIVEDRDPDADPLADIGTVIIDNLSDIEVELTGEVTIDVSNVSTTGNNTFWIREEGDDNPSALEDNDTTFSAVSVLDPADAAFSAFSVTLADLDSTGTPDELAGQTIRFTTEVQADGRVILVEGADGANPNKDEMDTNVVWIFNTVTGGLDVSGYDGTIGRIWVNDELVDSVGGDIDGLFTIDNPENPGTPLFTLDTNIIKRIEATDLDALLALNVPVNQRVEVTAFTQIAGAEFTITDPLVSILELRIDMGGATDINDLVLDNILGPVDADNPNFPGDDDFQLLTINSLLANNPDHYLLPDDWTEANPLPSNDIYADSFENNVVGDITSGPDRGVLHTIEINTFENDTDDVGVDADNSGADSQGITNEGAQFVAETIFFSDDGDTTAVGGDAGTPGATLNVNGDNDVTLKSLDTSDADITGLTVNQTGAHTLTVTGGSPAFDGDAADDTTTMLTLTGTVDNVVTFASTVTTNDDTVNAVEDDFITYNVGAGETLPYAGISGGALELIDAQGHAGTVSLGVISQVNSELFTLEATGAGQVFGCIGRALDDGTEEVPELSATGVWTVNGNFGGDPDFGGVNNVDLEIKEVVFNAGGQLNLESVDLCISGDVDMSMLAVADLSITGTTTIEVKAGATLTLTVAQVDALGAANIFGEGTVVVTGESDSTDAAIDTTFGNLLTATVDLSAVTLEAADTVLEIDANGARGDAAGATPLLDENGDPVAQTIIGSANNDQVTVGFNVDDSDPTTTDLILQLGADTGVIGVADETPSANTPVDATPEVAGDTVIKANPGNIVIEASEGYDQVDILEDGDVVQVAAGAEFYAASVGATGFTATADTTNDGVAVIELDGVTPVETVDVSDAGGANGWTLIGSADGGGGNVSTLIGSAQADVLVDGTPDDGDNDGEEDVSTGGAGADLFQFAVELSDVGTFTNAVTTAGADVTDITPTAAFAGQTLQFNFRIGPFAPTQVTLTDGDPDVDFSSAAAVATSLQVALNARADADATIAAGVVTGVGVNGARLDLINVVQDPGGAPLDVTASFTVDDQVDAGTYADDAADTDDDDRAINTIDIAGPIAVGETYTVEVTRSDGSQFTGTFVTTTTVVQDVVNGLADALNVAAGGDIGFSSLGAAVPAPADTLPTAAVANQIVAYDNDADNGGFTISGASGTASISGAGSSSLLTGAGTLDDADADVVTDFMSGEDTITFGLDAGSNSNYDEGAEVADFNTAETAANAAMDGTVIYYLTSSATAGEEGLLFYDANGDGVADGVVHLVGIDSGSFDEDDIV